MVFLRSTRNPKTPNIPKVLNSILWYVFLNNLLHFRRVKHMPTIHLCLNHFGGSHSNPSKSMVHPFETAQLLSLFFTEDCYYLWKQPNVIQGPIMCNPEYCITILSEKWNMNMSLYMIWGFHSQKGFNTKSWMVFKKSTRMISSKKKISKKKIFTFHEWKLLISCMKSTKSLIVA